MQRPIAYVPVPQGYPGVYPGQQVVMPGQQVVMPGQQVVMPGQQVVMPGAPRQIMVSVPSSMPMRVAAPAPMPIQVVAQPQGTVVYGFDPTTGAMVVGPQAQTPAPATSTWEHDIFVFLLGVAATLLVIKLLDSSEKEQAG